jgi:ferredoxin-NADP reductase
MLVTLDHVDNLAGNIHMFWFKPEEPMRNIPGQFTEIFLPHDSPDNRGTKRWFTLSSSPTEELAAITTRLAGEKGSSFKDALSKLKPGAELDMARPMGDFTLPKDKNQEIVYVAGGIGITPMRSMAKYLTDTKERRPITLIHAVSAPEDLVFKDLFTSYGLNYIPVVGHPDKSWKGESGQLDGQRIIKLAEPEGKLFYLSGPEPMIEALANSLHEAGVPKKQIVTDFFPGYEGI